MPQKFYKDTILISSCFFYSEQNVWKMETTPISKLCIAMTLTRSMITKPLRVINTQNNNPKSKNVSDFAVKGPLKNVFLIFVVKDEQA